jgi:hypothetical protein
VGQVRATRGSSRLVPCPTGFIAEQENSEVIAANTDQRKLLLNERDAARVLSISPRKLWSIRSAGEITYVRLGRLVRYAVEDLESWIDHRKQPGSAVRFES